MEEKTLSEIIQEGDEKLASMIGALEECTKNIRQLANVVSILKEMEVDWYERG